MSESSQPLISVLIPIYNVVAYLDECLGSVAAQTFTDFEAICINDGSTDGSLDIILSYVDKDSRFQLIDKANSGYGASMNRGLDAARGQYIAILESDDFMAPGALAELYQAVTDFDAEVAKANCYYYWPGRLVTNRHRDLVPRQQCGRLINPQEEHDIFFYQPSVWSALYRREFLLANDIRFTETPGASYQDTSFNLKLWISATRAVFLPQALVHYRQDNQASSVKAKDKAFAVVDEFHEVERFAGQHGDGQREAAHRENAGWLPAVIAALKFQAYLWNYERLAEELQLDFLMQVSTELAADDAAGRLDRQLLEPRYALDLESILRSPTEYHRQRQSFGGSGRLAKARHYLKLGGLPLLFGILKSKLFVRS